MSKRLKHKALEKIVGGGNVIHERAHIPQGFHGTVEGHSQVTSRPAQETQHHENDVFESPKSPIPQPTRPKEFASLPANLEHLGVFELAKRDDLETLEKQVQAAYDKVTEGSSSFGTYFKLLFQRGSPEGRLADILQAISHAKVEREDNGKAMLAELGNPEWDKAKVDQLQKDGASVTSEEADEALSRAIENEDPAAMELLLKLGASMTPDALILRHQPTLEAFSHYGTSDVARFSGNINQALPPEQIQEIRDRYRLMPQKTSLEAEANSVGNKIGTQYSQHQINSVGPLIWHAGSGSCTTFALAAAHTLLGGDIRAPLKTVGDKHVSTGKQSARDPNGMKIELVTVPGTHAFSIVGRQGELADPSSWGKDARIVDPWLGSLGHETVFTADNYPYQSWLHGLELNYDSTAPEPKQKEDSSPETARLKTTNKTGITSSEKTEVLRQIADNKIAATDPTFKRVSVEQGKDAFYNAIALSSAVESRFESGAALREATADYFEQHFGALNQEWGGSLIGSKGQLVELLRQGNEGQNKQLLLHRGELVQRMLVDQGVKIQLQQHRLIGSKLARPETIGSPEGTPVNIFEFGPPNAPNFDAVVKTGPTSSTPVQSS